MTARHVRPLAVMQLAQGAMESLWGLIFGFSPGGTDGSSELWVLLSLGGLATAAIGQLRMLAGLLNLFWRGRRFGLVVSNLGLVSAATFCCLPTSFGLFVYGWVVYTNAEVRRAFETGGRVP